MYVFDTVLFFLFIARKTKGDPVKQKNYMNKLASMILHWDLCILLFFPFVFGLSVYSGAIGNYSFFYRAIGVGSTILLCILAVLRKYEYPIGIGKYVICAIVIIVVSSVIGAIRYGNLKGDIYFVRLEIVFACFIFFLVAFTLNKTYTKQYNLGICVVSWLIFFSAIYGLVDYIIYHAFLGDFVFRLHSVYLNPIPGGHIFLFGLWLPLTPNNLKGKSNEIVIKIIVYMPAIMLCQSRSIWLGLAVSALVYFICNIDQLRNALVRIPRTAKIVCSIILLVIMCVCAFIFMRIFMYRFSGSSVQQPINLRLSYISYTLSQVASSNILEIIFGHGFDWSRAMIIQSPVYEEPYGICDNGYMTALYDWGLISIILVGYFLLASFYYVKRNADNQNGDQVKKGAAMALIASVIPSFFYDIQGWITPMILILSCMVYFIPAKSGRVNIIE